MRAQLIVTGCLAALLSSSACGPQAQTGAARAGAAHQDVAAEATRVYCQYRGQAAVVELRAPRGFPYAEVNEGQVQAQLDELDGELRIHAAVTRGGWHLLGWSHPQEDRLLAMDRVHWIHEGVALASWARPRILGAEPGRVHLDAPHLNSEDGDRLALLAEVDLWAPCETLRLSPQYSWGGDRQADWVALGFDRDLPRARLDETSAVHLSVSPGGEPFFRINPGEEGLWVRVVDSREGQTKVLFQSWRGPIIVGWTDSALVRPVEAGGGGGGLLGSLGGSPPYTRCASQSRLDLFAATTDGGEPELVGFLDAETPFIRGEVRGSWLQIRPDRGGAIRVSEGASVVIPESSQLDCEEVPPSDSQSAMLRVLGTLVPAAQPERVLDVRAHVSAVSGGLSGVTTGTVCTAQIEHFPTNDLHPCRVELRCGEHVLYGDLPTNGFLPRCDVSTDPLAVSGADPETTSVDTDGAFSLDTAQRQLRARDDASGRAGAFEIEAVVQSVELAPED